MEISLRGLGVSPGIAIGPALTFGSQSLDIPRYNIEHAEQELTRFDRAADLVRKELTTLCHRTALELGDDHANIFKSHILLLDDVTMRQEIEKQVKKELLNVEFLVDKLIAHYSKVLREVDDPLFHERTSDLRDVGMRILGKLLNTELENLRQLEQPCIIITHDLSPSDVATIDVKNALGIATDVSGPTSHTAILARALEIPTVVGLKYVAAHVIHGDMVILDGASGYVFIRPEPATLKDYQQKKQQQEKQREVLLDLRLETPRTLDGHEVPTLVNIELPIEVEHSLAVKAQGVGLYRTEYLFLSRKTMPTEEEQFQAYAQVAKAMKSAPVVLRTLDIGGDKFASHMEFEKEINPQLGWRAVRFCLERPDIFKTQLRAMLRASVLGNVQIMFPMISGVDELCRVLEVLQAVREEMEQQGVPFNKDIKVGTMIEVPSAVIIADQLAEYCDFFSIGTNDLIQYSLAVDRINEKIAHLYEPAHPAILRMIIHTAKVAKAKKIPCSLCGEMAGDPLFTEFLIGAGITSLSMSSLAIPMIRAEIANTRLSQAKKFTKHLATIGSVSKIRSALQERFRERNTLDRYLSQLSNEREPGKKE